MRVLALLGIILAATHDTLAFPKDPADGSDFVNCGQFTVPSWTIPQWNCLRFLGYPANIAGAIVDVYIATDSLATSTPASDALTAQHIKQVREGIDKSLPDYASFATVPPKTIFVLSPDVPQINGKPANANGLTICSGDKATCYIWIRMDRPEDAGDVFGIQRTTAHELYHTIQQTNHDPYQSGPTTGWWIEGAASFFGTTYYPDHRAGTVITSYYPNNPLFNPCPEIDTNTHECRGYGAFLLFQFLSNKGLSLAQIHRLVMRQSGSTAISDARRTMSRDAELPQYWSQFAQAFRDTKILFSDGSTVPLRADEPNVYNIVEQNFVLSLPRNAASQSISIKAKTFAFAIGKFTLKAGLTVDLKVQPLPTGSTLYWRAGKATLWDPFTADQTLVIPCAGSLNVEFLFTSTRDVEEDVAPLSVTRKSKKKCRCKRQSTEDNDEEEDEGDDDGDGLSCPIDTPSGGGTGFALWPLYYPTTAGGYCPNGTHPGKKAIWCCPTGTDLDEAVEQQASICCQPGVDCSKEIIPNNLRCADSSWTLWSKDLRQVGCCMEGYVPNLGRYCVTDKSQLGRGYSVLSYGKGAASTTTPPTSRPTSSSKPSRASEKSDATTTGSEAATDADIASGDANSLDLGRKTSTSIRSTTISSPSLPASRSGGSVIVTSTLPSQATGSSVSVTMSKPDPSTAALLQPTSGVLRSETVESVAIPVTGFILVTTASSATTSSAVPQTEILDAAGFILRGLAG